MICYTFCVVMLMVWSGGYAKVEPLAGYQEYPSSYCGEKGELRWIKGVSNIQCKIECDRDDDCVAIVYVAASPGCWLKATCAVSALKGHKKRVTFLKTALQVPGYKLFQLKYCATKPIIKWIKGGTPESCATECNNQENCAVFTYIFGSGCEINTFCYATDLKNHAKRNAYIKEALPVPGYTLFPLKYCGTSPIFKWIPGGTPEYCATECNNRQSCRGLTYTLGSGCQVNKACDATTLKNHPIRYAYIKGDSKADQSTETRLSALEYPAKNKAAFSVYASKNVIDLIGDEVVPFDTIILDPWNTYSDTLYEYTCAVAGIYVFTLCINVEFGIAGVMGVTNVNLEVNDNTVVGVFLVSIGSSQKTHNQGCNSVIYRCNVGDKVRARNNPYITGSLVGTLGNPAVALCTLSGFVLYPE